MVQISFNGYFVKYLQIVDGTDISELLMDNVTKFPMDNLVFDKTNLKDVKDLSVEPLNNFRELLLQGNKSDTLGEWHCSYQTAINLKNFTITTIKFFKCIEKICFKKEKEKRIHIDNVIFIKHIPI